MSRLGWAAVGGLTVGGLVAGVGLPLALGAASVFGDAELTQGITPVSCGSSTKIQQVSRTTPKVAGWSQQAVEHASTIVQVGEQMQVPPRGWVIAVATAMQESSLRNLGHLGARNDHDSQGLFQQRPSQGWGTVTQITTPSYAARKFYERLLAVKGWQSMELTQAAQRVQRSAYPRAYAKWEDDAADVVDAVSGGAAQTPVDAPAVGRCAADTGAVASSGWVRPVHAPIGSGFRSPSRPTHQGVDLIAKRGAKVFAAAAGTVIHMECDRTERGYRCDRDGGSGEWPGGCGWYLDIRHANNVITRYCHLLRKPLVGTGDKVRAGQQIGVVGSTGHSSGPHLHFEVHLGSRDAGTASDPVKFMRKRGAPLGTSEEGGERAA